MVRNGNVTTKNLDTSHDLFIQIVTCYITWAYYSLMTSCIPALVTSLAFVYLKSYQTKQNCTSNVSICSYQQDKWQLFQKYHVIISFKLLCI